jgi:hypothetical protein
MDEDTISGDDLICETDITVTSTSLQQRSSSVLWHTLVFKSLHSGHVRLGIVWVPAISEPIAISSIRPEEYVPSGALYVWIVEARDLRDCTVLGMRPTSPPEIEIEVRPYAKKGKKRAKVCCLHAKYSIHMLCRCCNTQFCVAQMLRMNQL